MHNFVIDWREWARSSLQTTTLLGLAFLVLTWGGIEFYLDSERTRAETGAIRSTSNLARVFEEHITRTIKDNDRVMRQLQLSSVRGTLSADFDRLVVQPDELTEPGILITLTDASGIVTRSNAGLVGNRIDLSDRDHFKAHRQSSEAGLYISPPLMGRISKRWTILLTRALRGPHGQFAGTVTASIDAGKLAELYGSVELGPYGAVNLVGEDGIVRASAGMQVASVGASMRNTELLRNAAKADEGWFTTPGTFDGVKRIMSFRRVDGYPLILAIGRSQSDIFANYWQRRDISRALASGLTLFVLIVIAVNMRRRRGLELARAQLRASEALAREKSHELELTLDHMSQGLMMIDADDRVAVVNRRAVELLDLPDMIHFRPTFNEVMAHHLAHDEYGEDGKLVPPQIWDAIKAGNFHGPGIYERTRPNGVTLEVRTSRLPEGGIVRTFTDISERKSSEEKIAHMAHHDALTGLANRVLLCGDIETSLRRQRRQGEGFALLLIDLDRFKAVNDTLGHASGDELLRCVAKRLRSCVREVDTVARLGGDEFAILQAATMGRETIEVLAQRVIEVVSAPYMLDGIEATIGASIGIARSLDSPDVGQLLHNADLALYRVKAEGRNGFRLFEPEMDATAQARRRMELELRQACDRGELEIAYQPIYDLATCRIVNVEALLRWRHPTRGLLMPADFLPLAEEIGVMVSIDRWVLEAACAEAARWPSEIEIAVNLSPAIFRDRALLDAVRRTLADSGLAARRLELEISERIPLSEDDGSLAQLRALRELGVRIALDDFGTGRSSLSDLRIFPFDKIKIDQTFVGDIGHRTDCAAIVAAVAGLGRTIGAQTTAEGIETDEQVKLVRAAGCTQAQGYFFSRPVSAGAIAALLDETADASRAVA